ncbi:methylated-DNA--[protein]-cysteine S-methyltransferase [Virgibacillus sp. MSP4-1]|uniref:methylated-DNA--[protein]-cysteine S-methyltransferase n=1 Tax=Virgibacillus sp. MSP4-1 TaxID=2700081 RepID=UPI0003A93897|nr:methylated-DNA--[protein]-cysteine S-methyltransferase [Virgibacillus sp. MSP4-1]QHS21527.1 methylated-DNA--[protein]-cysteine S-methyltransferase [Virgibacillus sp. MSP4-1]
MNKQFLFYDEIQTNLGPVTLMMKDESLLAIQYGKLNQLREPFQKWLGRHFDQPVFERNPAKLLEVTQQLEEYFNGTRTQFELSYEIYGTPFQKQIWQALSEIPYGEVRTYKEIAQLVQSPKAQRAVGGAVNRNPLPIFLPCHRVVGSNGTMTGYAGGLGKKEFLLHLEGCSVESQ